MSGATVSSGGALDLYGGAVWNGTQSIGLGGILAIELRLQKKRLCGQQWDDPAGVIGRDCKRHHRRQRRHPGAVRRRHPERHDDLLVRQFRGDRPRLFDRHLCNQQQRHVGGCKRRRSYECHHHQRHHAGGPLRRRRDQSQRQQWRKSGGRRHGKRRDNLGWRQCHGGRWGHARCHDGSDRPERIRHRRHPHRLIRRRREQHHGQQRRPADRLRDGNRCDRVQRRDRDRVQRRYAQRAVGPDRSRRIGGEQRRLGGFGRRHREQRHGQQRRAIDRRRHGQRRHHRKRRHRHGFERRNIRRLVRSDTPERVSGRQRHAFCLLGSNGEQPLGQQWGQSGRQRHCHRRHDRHRRQRDGVERRDSRGSVRPDCARRNRRERRDPGAVAAAAPPSARRSPRAAFWRSAPATRKAVSPSAAEPFWR